MTSVSMSDMMTKFKVSVQPHLDKGEEVLVVDGKSGAIRCRICPPVSPSDIQVDWQSRLQRSEHQPIALSSNLDDPIADAIGSSRDDSRFFK
jgi:hypothetical protein